MTLTKEEIEMKQTIIELLDRLDEAKAALKAERERAGKLMEALGEINDPISAMRNRLQDGENLNGLYAVQFSESANYLKGIARTAINEYNNKP